jgi:hypothetical protein
MLVFEDWSEFAPNILYESILVHFDGIGSTEKLVALLQTPGRGSQLA